MAQEIKCDINAGMERVFTYLKDGKPCSISNNLRYDVLFEIENPNKPTEKRFFHVIERSSGTKKLTVPLNDLAGEKPLNGRVKQYEPMRRPNPRVDELVDVTFERVVCAEINLSADKETEVYLRIDPNTDLDDSRRYLTFKGTGIVTFDESFPYIPMNGDGGKKPLGGAGD